MPAFYTARSRVIGGSKKPRGSERGVLEERDPKPVRRRSRGRRIRREHLLFLAFIAPNFVILGIFTYWPLLYQFYLSLTSWNFLSPEKPFVGLANYRQMFAQQGFLQVLGNTFYFMAAVVAGSLVLGLAVALLLNQKLKGRNLVRSIVFTPYVLSGAAIGLVWDYIFDPHYGLIHAFLEPLGIPSPNWLNSTAYAMPALIIVYLWKNLGFSALVYLAALQNIPRDLYDAAAVDGAGKWASLRHVTIPQLAPATFFVVVITMVQSFSYNAFDIIYVMTQGGPVNATTTLIWYIYQQGFQAFNIGIASAASTVLFIILVTLLLIQNRYVRRRTEEM
ncbi:MAG: sugar ABC transporter permease [Rubrobacteraceae bacterium]|nr:sugar ABC transporter permease [Rubrobacteraceae bacterium]